VMVEMEGGRDGKAADRLRGHGFELVEEVTSSNRPASAPTYGFFVRPDS